tara:strand:- start:203 stop:601 length:399 start_codon:yes stop_codon:yes gene_type:complete
MCDELTKLKDQDLLNDLFTTAIEGGVSSWADVTAYDYSSDDWYATIETENLEEDAEGLVVYRIDEQTIFNGIKLFAGQERKIPGSEFSRMGCFSDVLISTNGEINLFEDYGYDVVGADMIIQLGLFNQVVYG